MKKILTLFVMLLCGWSIVSAQAPVFGYQAVVRNADNELVANATVDVAIQVVGENQQVLYAETKQGLHTDTLGMLSILVGNSTNSLADIDWSKATTIRATVTANGNPIVVETPVLAVPYALKSASSKLTTEQIVAYLSDTATTIDDYKEIMDSLVNNAESHGELWQIIKNKFVQYLKENKDKAVDVAKYYLANADVNDVNELYNVVRNKPEVVAAAVNLAKQHALANKEYALEVLEAYLNDMTTAEVDEVYNAIMTHEEQLLPYLVEFAKQHRALAFNTVNYFLNTASAQEVNNALGLFETSGMKTAFVDVLFYDYLDAYISGRTTTLTNAAVQTAWGNKRTALDAQYYQNNEVECTEGGQSDPVDVCRIAYDVDQLKNQ
ncbi:MAG: hypothetical protein J6X81_02965 [Muribaculaceae bacterium]|nr:hypothetical protein [Muribaculaceae bacterium]